MPQETLARLQSSFKELFLQIDIMQHDLVGETVGHADGHAHAEHAAPIARTERNTSATRPSAARFGVREEREMHSPQEPRRRNTPPTARENLEGKLDMYTYGLCSYGLYSCGVGTLRASWTCILMA